jgi:RNA polymerase sigma-70 factor, ECF subfamily
LPFSDADHFLIVQIAQKNQLAYRELMHKYMDLCVRVAERMVGNRQDAEDITQIVCFKIWHEAERWQPQAKFSTWLYRVVLNASIDHKRRQVPVANLDLDLVEDQKPGAEKTLIDRERGSHVRRAIGDLGERQRAAIILSYYEQISNKEAANVMGLPLGAFEQLLYRARQNLKQDLRENLQEEKHG